MECFLFLAGEKGGWRWAEGRGRREYDRLWKGMCGGEVFFSSLGNKKSLCEDERDEEGYCFPSV